MTQALRDGGVRVTRQREALVRVLTESADHPDATELHRRAQAIDDTVSLATVYRTLTVLEREGVITGYHARVDPRALGRPLLVFVELKLAAKSNDAFERVKKELAFVPEVMECHLVSGDFDYLIKARISEMASYRKLLGSTLLTMPNVRESKSYIVMEEVKETLSLPIPD